MVFDDCGYKLIRDTDIEKILIRAMNAYYRQNPDQVYLVMVIVKGEKASFTIL
jgi:hypothetical protein